MVKQLVVAILLLMINSLQYTAQGGLVTNYYKKSCPQLEFIVFRAVTDAIAKEARMGASLLRLHFHDCFVQGCDGSLLLDASNTEKTAPPNLNSVIGFNVIDNIKKLVENACPGIVSCADILGIAARDSTVILGGPTWNVELGRRDSLSPGDQTAITSLPPASTNLDQLISKFAAQGLSVQDMVALSGSHTIGQARCTNFRAHIYNDSTIDAGFAKLKKRNCPVSGSDNNLAPLDLVSPNRFDNFYFTNLIQKKGLLHSDQELFNGSSTDSLVYKYARNKRAFFNDFAQAMISMGRIDPLTGSQGEVRKSCRKAN